MSSDLIDNKPLAYKRGWQNFYGRDFIVTPDVLIPRPETEQLIDIVLNLAGKSYLPGVKATPRILPRTPKILDVGTGSGCIAITLQLELPKASVVGVDISEKALRIAQKNATKFGVSPHLFIISNLLQNVKFTPDLIVANLPYVDKTWDWLDMETLKYEPNEALYATEHGLKLIYKILNEAHKLGVVRIILEADPCQHDEIVKYAAKNSYALHEKRGFILSFYTLRG